VLGRRSRQQSAERLDLSEEPRREEAQKGLFEEYAEFGRGHGHDLAPFERYHETRGLRWPVVDGEETRWRYREGHDP
jgi:hypothetical protein